MLHVRFPLSLQNAEDLLHERGVVVNLETVRFWWHRFGPMFATELSEAPDQGHAIEPLAMASRRDVVKTNGEMHYLWRVVDHEGEVLESYVTKIRDRKAALKFFRKEMRKHGRPEAIVTDMLRLRRSAERNWRRLSPGYGTLGEQPGGEFTPPVPTT